MAIKLGIRTSEFWVTVAAHLIGAATVISTLFDKNFLNVHPLIAGLVAAGALILTGLSGAAYSVSRGLVKSGNADSSPVAV